MLLFLLGMGDSVHMKHHHGQSLITQVKPEQKHILNNLELVVIITLVTLSWPSCFSAQVIQ